MVRRTSGEMYKPFTQFGTRRGSLEQEEQSETHSVRLGIRLLFDCLTIVCLPFMCNAIPLRSYKLLPHTLLTIHLWADPIT